MSNTSRDCKNSIAAWTIGFLGLALVMLPGCASDKPKEKAEAKPAAAVVAPTPAPQPVSLGKIKSELMESKAQLAATNDSLNKLQKSSPADAQANYNTFSQEYLKMQSKADALSARSKDLKDKAAAYHAMWNKQMEIDNPELRQSAVQQKAQAEQTFNNIKSEMDLARLSFDPYMSNLKDAGNYLRGNLSPANLSSAGSLVEKANGQFKDVNTHLDAIITAVDKISAATGEGAAAAAAAGASAAPAAGAAAPAGAAGAAVPAAPAGGK
jgi:hypothetical protein